MKPRVFIHIRGMEIGGAERALLGLLSAIDPQKISVDLFLNKHYGDFFPLIPEYINILPEIPQFKALEGCLTEAFKSQQWKVAIKRLLGKIKHQRFIKKYFPNITDPYNSLFQYIADSVDSALPPLYRYGKYDLAISFLTPHNIVLNKVNANKKICWIHTDYGTINIDKVKEMKIWGGYDNIISISDECRKGFISKFPNLESKILDIENILSPSLILKQAEEFEVFKEMPEEHGCLKLLTIGRFSPPKNIESIPEIAYKLVKKGINIKWYIIGYGDDTIIQEELHKFNIRKYVKLIGKKINPYPYLKACDVYVQPSKFEGKSVAVREAQILGKPVIVTNYPTAKSQIKDGIDGIIVPMDVTTCASSIGDFLKDSQKLDRIKKYLKSHDYGNEDEIEKIYHLIGNS